MYSTPTALHQVHSLTLTLRHVSTATERLLKRSLELKRKVKKCVIIVVQKRNERIDIILTGKEIRCYSF